MMELTDLSLATRKCCVDVVGDRRRCSSLTESENVNNYVSCNKKRKHNSNFRGENLMIKSSNYGGTTFDLQLKDPLPLDWEQCLDLESGRMYYLNRKTSKKSWDYPQEQNQKLDLELNISTTTVSTPKFPNYDFDQQPFRLRQPYITSNDSTIDQNLSSSSSSGGTNMVALACLNCHLLVILSKSSPSCPNCKYVHSLPNSQPQLPLKLPASAATAASVKCLNTLSLLN